MRRQRLRELGPRGPKKEFPELHAKTVEQQRAAARVEAVLQEFPAHAGKIGDTLKKELGPNGPKKIGDIPETHLRPLVSINDDDETLVAAYSKAQDILQKEFRPVGR